MRLGFPILPGDGALVVALSDYFRRLATKIDALSSGALSGTDNAQDAMPTAGTWAKGDFVRNSVPVVAGAAASQYVITGWVRLTDGSANVLNTDWAEARTLTGT